MVAFGVKVAAAAVGGTLVRVVAVGVAVPVGDRPTEAAHVAGGKQPWTDPVDGRPPEAVPLGGDKPLWTAPADGRPPEAAPLAESRRQLWAASAPGGR